jgi:hypothetical protein
MPREAGHVHLVDDQVLCRTVERLVALPVIIVNVDDDAAHRGRQIVGRPDGVVSIEERSGGAQRVWVNEDLVAVESEPPTVKVLRPIDTVGILSAWPKAPDVDVPEKEGLVLGGSELDDLGRLDVILPLKEKQLDARGITGEDREIHSLLIDSGA